MIYSLLFLASIETLQFIEVRSKQSVCKRLNASAIDKGFVLPSAILVDFRDACDCSTVGAFSFASIGVFVAPFPVVVSCFLGCTIFYLSLSWIKFYPSAFCDLAAVPSIE